LDSGNQKGVARFDGDLHGSDLANAIAISPDGQRVFVTGESQTVDVGREVVTIAYDSRLSDEEWVVRHNTSDSDSAFPDGRDDVARLIQLSDDGRTVIIGGDSWGENSLDWMLVAYDADNGAVQWTGLYDGVISHADFYRGLVVNGDASRVFVTGHSCSCGISGYDILTLGIRVAGMEAMAADSPWPISREKSRNIREAVRRR
jgi:hypothetical protein